MTTVSNFIKRVLSIVVPIFIVIAALFYSYSIAGNIISESPIVQTIIGVVMRLFIGDPSTSVFASHENTSVFDVIWNFPLLGLAIIVTVLRAIYYGIKTAINKVKEEGNAK